MENLMEMENLINGEKYLITVTKVEETNDECTNCTCEVSEAPINLSDILPKFEVEDADETEEPLYFSVKNIPNGLSIDNWLTILKEFNIILTK